MNGKCLFSTDMRKKFKFRWVPQLLRSWAGRSQLS